MAIQLPGSHNIIEEIYEHGRFDTFKAALDDTNLTDYVMNTEDITVLAPTDEAFFKLSDSTRDELFNPANRDRLTALVKRHIIGSKRNADQMVLSRKFQTLEGEYVDIHLDKGEIYINGARVIKSDLHAKNGMIHIIDQVLMPE